MRKWAFLVVAAGAAAVIGCGGGGGGSSSGGGAAGGGAGGGGGPTPSSVNLPNTPGHINIQFLTGQGRAIGDPTAVIKDISVTDSNNAILDDSTVTLRLLLNGYQTQIGGLNSLQLPGTDSRFFTLFNLSIQDLELDNGPGNPPTVVPSNPTSPAVTQSFACAARTELGRQTSIPIFLDDAMLTTSGNNVIFDANLFQTVNFDPISNLIQGFLSDYVEFDLSQVSNSAKPSLTGGAVANKVYFSGDGMGVSDEGPAGVFESVTSHGVFEGQFTSPGSISSPGTYTLLAPDPTDVNNIRTIVSLQGIWRDYSTVISNPGAFETFVFPNTAESLQPDVVMIQRNVNTGNITNMYFGTVNYAAGTFAVFPIGQMVTMSSANQVNGTISGFVDENGATVSSVTTSAVEGTIRTGSFAFAPGTAPAGFPASGRFLVFRR